jgi:8-oxo-dGTP pyrophosphatase MutT (NUDIX family)
VPTDRPATDDALAALLARREIARLAGLLADRPGLVLERSEPDPDPRPLRHAAVALVMRLGPDGEPELLLIKRAEHEADPWSGHVALPGGRHEAGDATLEATAVRETYEETGLDIAREGRVLGTLDELSPSTPVLPRIVVRPYVALLGGATEITPSHEVAAAFWVPLAALREERWWSEVTIAVRGGERRVSGFAYGEYLVWGLTERILRQFVALFE